MGLRTLGWIVLGVFGTLAALFAWAAVRARARGQDLGAAFVPNALIYVAALLGFVNLAIGFSPAWLAYTVLAIQGVLLLVSLPWLWRLVKQQAHNLGWTSRDQDGK
jgi:hypothetical protein